MIPFSRPLVRLPRLYCAETLAAEVAALPASAWTPHPGRIPGNDAVALVTPGGAITDAFAGAMAPTEHLRRCRYMMEIMADLGGVWGRSRLMGLAPGADVPAHVDVGYYWRTHLRLHIPIVTNPGVGFTCDGTTVHMAPGECWAFDSFRMHNVRNAGTEKRVHLVIDTVGGAGLWDLIETAQSGPNTPLPAPMPAGSRRIDDLAFEQINAPDIMSGWEVRCHIDHLLRQVAVRVERDAIASRLDRFANAWAATWAQHGPARDAVPAYRMLIDMIRSELRERRVDRVLLTNQVPLDRALAELIFQVALPTMTAARPPLNAAAA